MSRSFNRYKDSRFDEPVVSPNDPNFTATDAPCGSRAKVEVMAQRHALGLPLHHPEDSSEFVTVEEKLKEAQQALVARSTQLSGEKESIIPAPLSPGSLNELKLAQIPTQP